MAGEAAVHLVLVVGHGLTSLPDETAGVAEKLLLARRRVSEGEEDV